jgi:hypothetical protein
VTKWNHTSEATWRVRVRLEAKRIALLISQSAIDGPDIADRIEQLVIQAATRKPYPTGDT